MSNNITPSELLAQAPDLVAAARRDGYIRDMTYDEKEHRKFHPAAKRDPVWLRGPNGRLQEVSSTYGGGQ